MNILREKFSEVLASILPVTIIVLILNFTLTPLETSFLIRFLIGAVFITLGLVIFLIGVDIGITPLGNLVGDTLVKSNKVKLIVIAGLVLGFFIAVAEPGLIVLSNQTEAVTAGALESTTILLTVAIGFGVLLTIGLVRIVFGINLNTVLTITFSLIFLLALIASPEFLGIGFDASGSASGILVVPFILALARGISKLNKDSKKAEEDSFGLVSFASFGAIIGIMILGILSGSSNIDADFGYVLPESISIVEAFISTVPGVIKDSILAILPILVVFLILQRISFNLDTRSFRRMIKAFIYTAIGLILFLLGVNAGFMDVGSIIGHSLGTMDNSIIMIVVAFFIGVVTVLAEPSVHVQSHQIEEVTSGYIKRKIVLASLSLGVGLALALTMLRIVVPGIKLWHYLLPGYIIAIALTYIVPTLFVGIAFDGGSVATGPMNTTFILALTQGAAEGFEGASILIDGFGMIATVAMMSIISLQILGFIFTMKSKKGGIPDEE